MIRFFLTSFFAFSLSQAAEKVVYITTETTDRQILNCTAEECIAITLSQLSESKNGYLNSNTTLIFLPGLHHLNFILTVSNLQNFSLTSSGNSSPRIVCTNNSRIVFNNSVNIRVSNLDFDGCGGNQAIHVEEFVFRNVNFIRSATALELIASSARIVNSSFVDSESVLRRPVKVRPCVNGNCKPNCNCTHQEHIEVKKGETFTVPLAVVDQVGNTVSGTVQTALKFSESGIAPGQLSREILAECTNMSFNVVSPHDSEELTLYASDRPYYDAEPSKMVVQLTFLPCSCPIGLQVSGDNATNCTCECHDMIKEYVEYCDRTTGLFVKKARSNVWISYINDTEPPALLVYLNCPYDYCVSSRVLVNLNEPNGADAQCAFNRSGLLCGACQPGLSLSLGSSRCLPCPSYWQVYLTFISLGAVLGGIALVVLMLFLNMTVAIGTISGLIFYANIVYTHRNILLPFQESNFFTVFISWLNLELGIDTCYFPGMDSFSKSLLQLVFPVYIILLVVLVIIISSRSSRFSNFIGKKDPVASLATLIFLSIIKFYDSYFYVNTRFSWLFYSNNSSEVLWLPDATLQLRAYKLIALIVIPTLLFVAVTVFTCLLCCTQLVRYCSRWNIFVNLKLHTFIEAYYIPFNRKHRYWIAVLIDIRLFLYILDLYQAIFYFIKSDPRFALTAIVFLVTGILVVKALHIRGRVYRKWPVDVLETLFFVNLLYITVFTWSSLDGANVDQKAVARSSVIFSFVLFLFIIFYHLYTYTSVFSKIKKKRPAHRLKRLLKWKNRTPSDPDAQRSHDDNGNDAGSIEELMDSELEDSTRSNENVTAGRNLAGPTVSEVELCNPLVTPSSSPKGDRERPHDCGVKGLKETQINGEEEEDRVPNFYVRWK